MLAATSGCGGQGAQDVVKAFARSTGGMIALEKRRIAAGSDLLDQNSIRQRQTGSAQDALRDLGRFIQVFRWRSVAR